MNVAVIGSCADLTEYQSNRVIADKLGEILARIKATVLFSIENDGDSLPTLTAKAAKEAGVTTIGFTHGQTQHDLSGAATQIIITNVERGGPREFLLISKAHIVIVLSGGSGTLMEIAMAYQQNKPIFAIKNTRGWAQKIPQYLDDRKRVAIQKVAIDEIEKRLETMK